VVVKIKSLLLRKIIYYTGKAMAAPFIIIIIMLVGVIDETHKIYVETHNMGVEIMSITFLLAFFLFSATCMYLLTDHWREDCFLK